MGQVKRGKMNQQQVDKLLTKLKGTLSYDEFKDVDMVVEAVIESVDLKQKIFAGVMLLLGSFFPCSWIRFTLAPRSLLGCENCKWSFGYAHLVRIDTAHLCTCFDWQLFALRCCCSCCEVLFVAWQTVILQIKQYDAFCQPCDTAGLCYDLDRLGA